MLEAVVVVASPFFVYWLLRAIFRPMAPCRWCGGRRKKGGSERWRNIECSHCDKGERMTWGGKLVRGQGRRWGR